MIPLRLGSPESFANLRAFLEDCGYTESEVCRRLGLEAQHEILGRPHLELEREPGDAVDLLIQFFLMGGQIPDDGVRQHLPGKVLESMRELGVLAHDASKAGLWHAPVCLYPMGRLYVASDRWSNPDGSHFTPPADIVYPALTRNTYRFLSLLPQEPCRRFLELCSGTGIAALAAASGYAREAWAVDITERSTRFAEFNRLLNGLANVTVLEGNLYEPVRSLSFDRIVAHPPYVPAVSRNWIFQDAGAEGEEITRGVVTGLAAHLEPGGRLYCLALGMDRREEPFENRVRGWLGEDEAEFDVLVVVVETHTPEQVASQPLLKGEIGHKEYTLRRAAFTQAGVEQFVYGLIVVQKIPDADRPPFTVRRQAGAQTGSAECDWALRWEAAAASRGGASFLLEAKPSRSRSLELSVIHRIEQGVLTPAAFTLQASYPYRIESHVHPWTVALLEACDGHKTGLELHECCRQQGWIPPSVAADEFARFLSSLVSGGFLELEGFKPPAAGE